jgi:hypothetical protein
LLILSLACSHHGFDSVKVKSEWSDVTGSVSSYDSEIGRQWVKTGADHSLLLSDAALV